MSGILVIAEHMNGKIAKISQEILGAGRAIKSEAGGTLKAVVLSDGNADLANALAEYNLDSHCFAAAQRQSSSR